MKNNLDPALDGLIRATQQAVGVTADGDPREKSYRAFYRAIVGREWQAPAPVLAGALDERTERLIATLDPRLQPLAVATITEARAAGIDARIIQGTRTYEEQAELRTKWEAGTGGKAARPGWSNHNFGLAFDCGIFVDGIYIDDAKGFSAARIEALYGRLAEIGKGHGLTAGNDWTGRDQDPPHLELRPAWAKGMSETEMLTVLRARKASGRDSLA